MTNHQQNLASMVYFDNAATTPMITAAIEAFERSNAEHYGNSMSVHGAGRKAAYYQEEASQFFGRVFGVPSQNIIFTSGGTESNNLAIWGALGGLKQLVLNLKQDQKTSWSIATTQTEHVSVTNVFKLLNQLGVEIETLPVSSQGLLQIETVQKVLQNNRIKLLSVHHTQSEIGSTQDLNRIFAMVREVSPETLIHVDAVQSFLKLDFDFSTLDADLISLSAHKVGGPKGIGALILGKRLNSKRIQPYLIGGTHQHGVRPGTVPVPLIESFRAAVEYKLKNLSRDLEHAFELQKTIIENLPEGILLNSPALKTAKDGHRAPQILNIAIPKLPSAVVVEALAQKGVCVSAGSACHSTNPKPNERLLALGMDQGRVLSSLRISLGPQNTKENCTTFIKKLNEVLAEYA